MTTERVMTILVADYIALTKTAAEVCSLVHAIGLDEPEVNEHKALHAARVLSLAVLRRLSKMPKGPARRPEV